MKMNQFTLVVVMTESTLTSYRCTNSCSYTPVVSAILIKHNASLKKKKVSRKCHWYASLLCHLS